VTTWRRSIKYLECLHFFAPWTQQQGPRLHDPAHTTMDTSLLHPPCASCRGCCCSGQFAPKGQSTATEHSRWFQKRDGLPANPSCSKGFRRLDNGAMCVGVGHLAPHKKGAGRRRLVWIEGWMDTTSTEDGGAALMSELASAWICVVRLRNHSFAVTGKKKGVLDRQRRHQLAPVVSFLYFTCIHMYIHTSLPPHPCPCREPSPPPPLTVTTRLHQITKSQPLALVAVLCSVFLLQVRPAEHVPKHEGGGVVPVRPALRARAGSGMG
jgi:hypothetical protein